MASKPVLDSVREFYVPDPTNQLVAHRLITPEDLDPTVLKQICNRTIASYISTIIRKEIQGEKINSSFQTYVRTETRPSGSKVAIFFIYNTAYGEVAISHADPSTLTLSSFFEKDSVRTNTHTLAFYHFNTYLHDLVYSAAFDQAIQKFHKENFVSQPTRNPFLKA